MNITDLIARVRQSAFLPTASTNYTDAWICREINDQLTQLYERAVVKAQQGYWLGSQYQALSAGDATYRVPARACVGGIERVHISEIATPDWYPLKSLSESDAIRYEYSSQERPVRYVVRGEFIQMLPTPITSNTHVYRIQFARRPSRITLPQTTPATMGLITAVSTTSRTVTVSALPESIDEDGNKTALGTTALNVDVIRPSGWNSVTYDATGVTRSGNVFTFPNKVNNFAEANDMSDIQVGDWLLPMDQTNWPMLPQDFHRSLADATAGKILTQRSMHQKATELMASHVVPDLQRFAEMLAPRVGDEAYVFVAPDFR